MASHVASRFQVEAKERAAHTPENAPGPAMRLVIQDEEAPQAEEEEQVQEPPPKMRKLEGHRPPVPIDLKRE